MGDQNLDTTVMDTESGGEVNNTLSNAKLIGRQASRQMVKGSRKVAQRSRQCTQGSVDRIAQALPDSELMILAVILVTIFTRAEEAHLKRFCDNDGSVGWILTAIGCCVVSFAKYNDTRSLITSMASCVIYFLIQISLNYPPLGCLFNNLVVGSGGVNNAVVTFSDKTQNFAVVQCVILVVFAVVYVVVNYRKRAHG